MSNVLSLIHQEYPGYHPLVSIARLAHASSSDPRLQYECHKTIAKYVEPELKSLEVKGAFTEQRRVTISLFDENSVEIPQNPLSSTNILDAELVSLNQDVDNVVNAY